MSQKKRNFAVVIELDRHIEILLLSNDCVIVPCLGGFMTHHINARFDQTDNMFLPPLRTLGFNPQLTMNDSLLAQSYVEAYDISYPEAVRRIEDEVKELKQHIETEGFYELNDIGVLALNEEGHYEFTPCEAGILTPELYGLSSFEMPKLIADEPEILPEEPREHAITIKMSWIRNAVAVAAAILAFFFITPPIANSNMSQVQSSSILPIPTVDNGKQKPVVTMEADDDSIAAEPAAEEIVTEPVSEKDSLTDNQIQEVKQESTSSPKAALAPVNEGAYCIVLASQVAMGNAQNFVNQLGKKGLTEASVFTRNNMVRVIYGNYQTESEAYNALHDMRSKGHKEFAEAWVLKK